MERVIKTGAGILSGTSDCMEVNLCVCGDDGEYSKSAGTNDKMPVKVPISVKGGIYGNELKRTIVRKVNAADTGKVIINNPTNNLPPMTLDQMKRMDKILMNQ